LSIDGKFAAPDEDDVAAAVDDDVLALDEADGVLVVAERLVAVE
jgi:hypothetical protein